MFKFKLNFRIILIVALMHYALATSVSESLKKNSLKGKYFNDELKENTKKRVHSSSRSLNIQDELKFNELKRRQGPCFPPITCVPSPYRTYDGTCNNLNNPYWGSSVIPYHRILNPDYGVGFTPRGTGQSPPLPNSRRVSVAMTNTFTPSSPDDISLMVMQWGQFIDHDMVFTTNEADTGYSGSKCCTDFMDPTPVTENCQPIDVTSDPFYQQHNVKCLSFIRSTASPCAPGREQINEVTAYLDASQVYGSNDTVAMDLRVPNSYLLKSGPGNECPNDCSLDFLPERPNVNTGQDEFFAGDRRLEIQPGLTSIHTIFVRMHNHFAKTIRGNNPNYSDDIVFEEARKIVGALMQKITYEEFLPIVLGSTTMNNYGLNLQPIGSYFNGYNSLLDASASNVFAAASFRFGHSLISKAFILPGGTGVYLEKSFNDHLRTTFSNSFPSHFMEGICTDPSEEMDHILVDAVQNKLLAVLPFEFGSDLYARNIERGRDHGLRSYTEWLTECGGIQPSNFMDLYNYNVMSKEIANEMNNLYSGDLNGIDLYPAGIAEYSIPGGLIGPTFACLNARHFHKLKYGDSFWFENSNVFTMNQLDAIQSTTFASIICKYSSTSDLQMQVMLPPSPSNPLIPCSVLVQQGVVNDIDSY